MGRIIVFEGVDGSGKTTQIELLKKEFSKENFLFVREPGGTDIGSRIRDLLLNSSDKHIISELLLFMASRNQLYQEVVKPHLLNNGVVFYDRWRDSSVAYQGALGIDINLINKLNDLTTEERTADLTFYLKIPLEVAIKRLGDKQDVIESRGEDYFQKVIDNYNRLYDNNPGVVIIDAASSVDEVNKQITDCVRDYLSR